MKSKSSNKILFLDMDGTVCESRQTISKEVKRALSKYKCVIVSGAERKRILKQLNGLQCEVMAQNGNDTDLWYKKLSEAESLEIIAHTVGIVMHNPKSNGRLDIYDERGCQISLSLTGHSAPLKEKLNFDPSKKIRNKLLKLHPFKSKTLTAKVAGTTCIDYNRKDGTKGKNIAEYIKAKGWKKKDCIYFGDNLQKGGNDETVKGVIKCVSVKNPQDLLKKLEKI